MYNCNVYLLLFYKIGKTYQIADIHTGANIFVQCAYINTSHLMYLTCSLHVRVICTMSCCTLLVQVTYTSHYTLLFEHLCTLYILQWKYMQCGILWNYMYYAKYTRCIPLPTLYQAVQCYNVNTTYKHLFIICVPVTLH